MKKRTLKNQYFTIKSWKVTIVVSFLQLKQAVLQKSWFTTEILKRNLEKKFKAKNPKHKNTHKNTPNFTSLNCNFEWKVCGKQIARWFWSEGFQSASDTRGASPCSGHLLIRKSKQMFALRGTKCKISIKASTVKLLWNLPNSSNPELSSFLISISVIFFLQDYKSALDLVENICCQGNKQR